ncbi:hypothetical protein IAT38_004782 [Cryptococcus sp. DSM 104549]
MASRAPLRIQRYAQTRSLATRSLFHSTSFTPSSTSTPNNTPGSPAQATRAQSNDGSEARATQATTGAREQPQPAGETGPQQQWQSRFSLKAARDFLFGRSAKSSRRNQPQSEVSTSGRTSSAGGEKGGHQPIAIPKSVSRDIGKLSLSSKPKSSGKQHPSGAKDPEPVKSDGTKSEKHNRVSRRKLPKASVQVENVGSAEQKRLAEAVDGAGDKVVDILKAVGNEPPSFTGEILTEGTIEAQGVVLEEVAPLREMKVSSLRTSLDRVLFNPGVHVLRDPRTGAWNFDKSVHDIPTPEEFAFHRLPQYIPPSQDKELLQLAQSSKSRFIGSTSTLTKALSQIYFAISGGKGVDLSMLSQDYAHERSTFTPGAELPAFINLQQVNDDCYSVDSSKIWDIPNVISEFGNILEKLLTAETEDFKRFLAVNPESGVPESERNVKEAYRYQKVGSLLMRSQLDCHDPRLPGSGVFDIKTRACMPIRHDRANYIENAAYDIAVEKGLDNSYEREYYDLLRATMLKYSFQVRIGGMDGIFLAYHNTKRVFGFQYVPLSDIDKQIFGSSLMADQAFKISVTLLEDILARCVQLYKGQPTSVTIKHTPGVDQNSVTVYVEPKLYQRRYGSRRPITAFTYTLENYLDGEPVEGPVEITNPEAPNHWTVKYSVSSTLGDRVAARRARSDLDQLCNRMSRMSRLSVPEGETVESMTLRDEEALREAKKKGEALPDVPRIIWSIPGNRQLSLRKMAKQTGEEYEQRKLMWAAREEGKAGEGQGTGEAPVAKVEAEETETTKPEVEESTAESTKINAHPSS